ncbi:endonuclease domain-containing protein [Sphingorhabdus sp. SMR4y]|uniref:endonuclease domain-containing protein n=1 Tax=Sphingorhabdus sp. SMR4y TaxID=2584094 RepID=UPI000B5EF646|nr:endonuclease domain-containing protein [Sphingorhabdus sp. SMR4y]ASK87384.1 DNA-cytosine methyltransferase [Sphingorhabdus sp. SMR4y]
MTDRATLLARAREMRRNPTEPEKRLWRHLSASQLAGHKFRRQAVIDYYIADFFCPLKKLIVEVDGDTHDIDSDFKRDDRLRKKGYRTVRFSNLDVMGNMDGVLLALVEVLDGTPDRWAGRRAGTTPNPSSEEEGLQ